MTAATTSEARQIASTSQKEVGPQLYLVKILGIDAVGDQTAITFKPAFDSVPELLSIAMFDTAQAGALTTTASPRVKSLTATAMTVSISGAIGTLTGQVNVLLAGNKVS